jgi:putative redox protein
MASAPTTASLTWTRDLQFEAECGRTTIGIDGRGTAGPSPVEALAVALAGCMAIDVVDIVTKGRHPLQTLTAALTAERAPDPPRRFVSVTLHFTIGGAVPAPAIERAIQLSRDKYCSVWQTLRQDIPFATSYEVHP